MKTINLNSVLPQVFAQRSDLNSEIWKQEVTFEKGHLYLIEADSGMGKSTFCSYIIGYRHDYSGNVTFDTQVTADYKVRDWVEVRKSHISHLFQELRLFPELSAFENVEIKNNDLISSVGANTPMQLLGLLFREIITDVKLKRKINNWIVRIDKDHSEVIDELMYEKFEEDWIDNNLQLVVDKMSKFYNE